MFSTTFMDNRLDCCGRSQTEGQRNGINLEMERLRSSCRGDGWRAFLLSFDFGIVFLFFKQSRLLCGDRALMFASLGFEIVLLFL